MSIFTDQIKKDLESSPNLGVMIGRLIGTMSVEIERLNSKIKTLEKKVNKDDA